MALGNTKIHLFGFRFICDTGLPDGHNGPPGPELCPPLALGIVVNGHMFGNFLALSHLQVDLPQL